MFASCSSRAVSAKLKCDLILLVVGEEEKNARAVNVRNRDDVGTKARTPTIALEEVLQKLVELKTQRRLENRIE